MKRHNSLALQYIQSQAEKQIPATRDSLRHVFQMGNISMELWEVLTTLIRQRARIGLHFHPYRLNSEGRSVAESLLDSGRYKNQFETQLSNGSPTAFIGGQRDLWENQLFDNIFAKHEIPFAERPKYGALALLGHAAGPSPRFGSCYFLLKPILSEYATFCYPDSYYNPDVKGTITCLDHILSTIFAECFERDYALGEGRIRPFQLIQKIMKDLEGDYEAFVHLPPNRNLDHYIEAQVHTHIELSSDVEYLVADQSYQHTHFHTLFDQLCQQYQLNLLWHPGYELAVDAVPDHFRGKDMPIVAAEIAQHGKINAFVLGQAERNIVREIQDATQLEIKLKQLKYLWHTLIKYG